MGAPSSFPALGCGLLLALCGGCSEPPPRPDVVLITLDTTRADYLSCYGFERETTPNIDALARAGVLFETCSSVSGITPVSHASILTGLDPYEHGLRVFSGWSGYRLPEDVPTLARILREAGYRTAAVHSAFPVSGAFGFDQGFDVFEDIGDGFVHDMAERSEQERVRPPVAEYQRRSDATTDLALDQLAGDGPLFLWVHYWDPHDAKIQPPDEWLPESLRGRAKRKNPRAREELYEAEVRFQDEQIGRLLAAVRERGRGEPLVALTSDHGQGLADGLERHGWAEHGILYREQLAVPLVMQLPGVARGARLRGSARTVDLLPTVLDYLGIEAPTGLTGSSLRAWIEGAEPEPRIAYAEFLNGYENRPDVVKRRPQADFLYSVSDGEWKLIYRPTRPAESELYHLERDPWELDDVHADEPAQVARLMGELAARDPWVDAPFGRDPGDVDPGLTSALMALGYASGERTIVAPRWVWRCPSGDGVQSERGACAHCGKPSVMVSDE